MRPILVLSSIVRVCGFFCNGIRKSAPTKSAVYKVTSFTYSLIQEKVIMSDIHLLVAIYKWFLFPHFEWNQLGNPDVGGTPSFISHNMLVRYYLMADQIKSAMGEKWQNMDEFKGFKLILETMDEEDKILPIIKVKQFLQIIKAALINNFGMWVSAHFLFISLFNEQKTAARVSEFLLGYTTSVRGIYISKIHGYSINLQNLQEFLNKYCSQESIIQTRSSPCWLNNSVLISLIVKGHGSWNTNAIPVLVSFIKL